MNKKMPRTPLSTPLSGSARETELRIRSIFSGPKRRPSALLLALMCAVCLLCGNLVSCRARPAEADGPEPSQPEGVSPAGSESGQGEPSPEWVKQASLGGLNLDGAGGNDDCVTVTSSAHLETEEWNTVVEASLGDGRSLAWSGPCPCRFPAVMAGYLTSEQRQCVVAELEVFGTNYGCTYYLVLEVEGDALVERARLGPCDDPAVLNPGGDSLSGGEVVRREGSPLQALRVPTFYNGDKWSDPLWGSLYWDGGAFAFELEDATAPLALSTDPSEPGLDAGAGQNPSRAARLGGQQQR